MGYWLSAWRLLALIINSNKGLEQIKIAMNELNLPQPGCHPERSEGSAQA